MLLQDITSIVDAPLLSPSSLCKVSLSLAQFWQNAGADYRLILAHSQVHRVEAPHSNVEEHTLTPGRAQTNCRLKGTGRSPALLFGPSVWLLLARRGVLGFPAGGGFALVVHSFGGDEEFGAELYWDDNDDNIGDA